MLRGIDMGQRVLHWTAGGGAGIATQCISANVMLGYLPHDGCAGGDQASKQAEATDGPPKGFHFNSSNLPYLHTDRQRRTKGLTMLVVHLLVRA